MWREAAGMIRKSGSVRPFFNGLVPTLYRDIVFGGCYTFLRFQIPYLYNTRDDPLSIHHENQWLGNMIAAALATVASGPWNYVRNVQYSTSSSVHAKDTHEILRELLHDAKQEPTLVHKLRLLQNRLRIGWGTTRVALGMAFAHAAYDKLGELLAKQQAV